MLGGQKVQIRRPGVRADGEELNLPKFQAFADTDPLNRRVVEQMFGRRCHAPVRRPGIDRCRERDAWNGHRRQDRSTLHAWRATSLDAPDLECS